MNRTTEIGGFTFLAVVRFDSTQRQTERGAVTQRWVHDIPSDTTGPEAICDRVQIETPIPLSGDSDQAIAMLQGERLRSDLDLDAWPELAKRMSEEGRILQVDAGTVYVSEVDLEDPDWRPDMLHAAARAGEIDETRWIVGMPGGLYLVPLK